MPKPQVIPTYWTSVTEDNNDLQDEGGGEGDQAGYDLSVLRFDNFKF